jgi:magnesium chelatase subunit D
MDSTQYKSPIFPFTAIVGQETLKLALAMSVIHPGIMGVLIRGQKGTAKSTTVRAMANLLPPIKAAGNCLYGCDPDAPAQRLCRDCQQTALAGLQLDEVFKKIPFVTLPINATEDNLVGSFDFTRALKSGEMRFSPGMLAKAHRGILYVDEVNLLDDHLVNLILDVSASGVNIVEREGISYSHPSEFILIGTMNPEEGELRPQLLDRFGLCINVEDIADITQRIEIIKRREAFEKDPLLFQENWVLEEKKERRQLEKAIELLDSVQIKDEKRSQIVKICSDAHVAGHRADITIENASKALAAYMGRNEVEDSDIKTASYMALPHRVRESIEDKLPPESKKHLELQIDDQPEYITGEKKDNQEQSHPVTQNTRLQQNQDRSVQLDLYAQTIPSDDAPAEDLAEKSDEVSYAPKTAKNEIVEIGKIVPVVTKDILHNRSRIVRNSSGQRNRSRTMLKRGRYIRSTMNRSNNDIAIDATLRAAAPHQVFRPKGAMKISIESEDIREKIRERKMNTLLIFIVDASGSMGAKLMAETKGAIMYLLLEAYHKRDKVSMIAFKDDTSEILLPPTDNIELAKKKLEDLPAGGKTPLSAGLLKGYEVVCESLNASKDLMPLIILITDGRANVGTDSSGSKIGMNVLSIYKEIFAIADLIHGESGAKSLVIDTEEKSRGTLGRAKEISEYMGAKYLVLKEIRSRYIAKAVQDELFY